MIENEDIIKTLIAYSGTEEKADEIVKKYSNIFGESIEDIKSKITFVSKLFKIENIYPCNDPDADELMRLNVDYISMLSAIITLKWS